MTSGPGIPGEAAGPPLGHRDHAAAGLLARVAVDDGAPDGTAEAALHRAWRSLSERGTAAGRQPVPARPELLRLVIDELAHIGALDNAHRPQVPMPFLGAADPWAGWWDREPAPWPARPWPSTDQVIRAVRQLPLGLRVVLLVRDVAGLTPGEAAEVLGIGPEQQAPLLENARLGLVTYLDDQITGAAGHGSGGGAAGGGAGTPAAWPGTATGTAADVSCRVVAGLVQAWHEGELADVESDQFEQHLLVCPPCLAYSGNLRLAMSALRATGGAAGGPGAAGDGR